MRITVFQRVLSTFVVALLMAGVITTISLAEEEIRQIGTEEIASEIVNDIQTGEKIVDALMADEWCYLIVGNGEDKWCLRFYKFINGKWELDAESSMLGKVFGEFPSFTEPTTQMSYGNHLLIDFLDSATAEFFCLPDGQWILQTWYSWGNLSLVYYPDVMEISFDQFINEKKETVTRRICGAYQEARKIENITLQMMAEDLEQLDLYAFTEEKAAVVASDSFSYISLYSENKGCLLDYEFYFLYQGAPVHVLQDEGITTQISVNGLTGYVMSKYVYQFPYSMLIQPDLDEIAGWELKDDENIRKQMVLYESPSIDAAVVCAVSGYSNSELKIRIIGESKDWFTVLTTLGTGFIEKKYFTIGNG